MLQEAQRIPVQEQQRRPHSDDIQTDASLPLQTLDPSAYSLTQHVDTMTNTTSTASAGLIQQKSVKRLAKIDTKRAPYVTRIRRGQNLEEIQATSEAPPLQLIDSPFQLQEYLALVIRHNPHDVNKIVAVPQATAAPSNAFRNGKGKAKEENEDEGAFMGEDDDHDGSAALDSVEEPHTVDTDVWVYEQLRRIVSDLTTPWLTTLQRDCDRKQRPTTCEAMNADDWMYLCASHGEEKQCCAIDYTIHTLDGTTALLNSHRHFPSRTFIPTTSLRHFGSVSRRISRIFVHAYEHHRDVFEACEAETSLYARFLALVQAYDLIAIDFLPRLGAQKQASGAEKAEGAATIAGSQADAPSENAGHAEVEATDALFERGAPKPGRSLFNHAEPNESVPLDETGEDEEEDDDEIVAEVTDDEAAAPTTADAPSAHKRSDSNASRITAIHVATSASDAAVVDEAPRSGDDEGIAGVAAKDETAEDEKPKDEATKGVAAKDETAKDEEVTEEKPDEAI